MWELSSWSGSSFSSPEERARRSVVKRVLRLEIVEEEVIEVKYEDMASSLSV